MDLKNIRTDVKKEDEGVWYYPYGDANAGFLLGRYGSRRFKAARVAAREKYARDLATGDSEEVSEKIAVEVMAEAIVLDWKGVKDDGKELPYSKENAIKVLGDPGLHDLRDLLVAQASSGSRYLAAEVQKTAKK